MRDRLIELLGKELMGYASWQTEMALAGNYDMPSVEEVIADKMLADGWIRPPCKLGDTIYDISEFTNHCYSPEMYEDKVGFITIMKRENGEIYFDIECIECDYNDFGSTLFLTREEAEAKLKEGAE